MIKDEGMLREDANGVGIKALRDGVKFVQKWHKISSKRKQCHVLSEIDIFWRSTFSKKRKKRWHRHIMKSCKKRQFWQGLVGPGLPWQLSKLGTKLTCLSTQIHCISSKTIPYIKLYMTYNFKYGIICVIYRCVYYIRFYTSNFRRN